MNTTSRIAAVAGSLVAGAAMAAAIILPLHHTPAGAATSGLGARTVTTQASASAGAQQSSGAGNDGPAGSAGAGSGSAAGSGGSGSSGSGSGSGSGNGSGSGPHLKLGPGLNSVITMAPPTPAPPHLKITPGITGIIDQAPPAATPTPTIWLGDWQDPQLGAMYYINGDGFSLGQVLVEVVAYGTGTVKWELTVNSSGSGNPGARIDVPTGAKDCSGIPNTVFGYYVVAKDLTTGLYSQMPLDSYC